jgi:flavoprotein
MGFTENNRVKIDLDICAQGEACVASCPVEAIVMNDGYPHLFKNCEGPCQECCDVCPSEAVRMKD